MRNFIFAGLLTASYLPVHATSSSVLLKKYPRHSVAASCSANFLNRPDQEIVVVLHETTYRVLLVGKNEEIKEIDSLPKRSNEKFEIQCMSSKEATEHKKVTEGSEGVHSFLKFPKGNGILCYFIDETTAKCWTNKNNTDLVEAGGWQT